MELDRLGLLVVAAVAPLDLLKDADRTQYLDLVAIHFDSDDLKATRDASMLDRMQPAHR